VYLVGLKINYILYFDTLKFKIDYMKFLFTLVFSCLILVVLGQNTDNKVVIGTIDTIHSKILNEKRAIWIYAPKNDPRSGFGKVSYPVVYLLDGDGHFSSVTSMIRQLSEGFTSFFPQMIIVGILNTDRLRDLTPTKIKGTDDVRDSTIFKSTGGGDKFMAFMEKELMPYIDSTYSTAPYRMFIGHSLGGLMVVDALLRHKNLFNSYVAIDPSLWYDDRNLMKQTSNILNTQKFNKETLYIAIANTMKPGMDTGRVRADITSNTSHIRSILDFTSILKQDKKSGLKWKYKYYGEDDHGSVPLIAEYDALRFIFQNYRLPSWEVLTDSSFNTFNAVTAHFKKISGDWGYQVHPPEQFVNSLAYHFLGKKNFEKSFSFFDLNIRNFPESFNVYDSMGDYYMAKEDHQKAKDFFEKALKIMDNPVTREKIKKID
jgi:predicted alpha/beta superfamily hydrolase